MDEKDQLSIVECQEPYPFSKAKPQLENRTRSPPRTCLEAPSPRVGPKLAHVGPPFNNIPHCGHGGRRLHPTSARSSCPGQHEHPGLHEKQATFCALSPNGVDACQGYSSDSPGWSVGERRSLWSGSTVFSSECQPVTLFLLFFCLWCLGGTYCF